MRLSTRPDRDDAAAIRVIHAALEAGATLLDTADSYCHDDTDTGHNERLVSAALREWDGDRSTVEVATKGGLRRPRGAWVADGRAGALRQACEASRRALDVASVDLYLLHAVDPKTPIETSVRALAALQKEGAIRRVGLCNVTVGQIEAARRIIELDTVEVSLSPFDSENLRNGVAEYCRAHGIRLIAHRPLGGERRKSLARDDVLSAIAAAHDVAPESVVLAWLMDLGVVPIPGATRESTARSLAAALALTPGEREISRLDERFCGRLLRIPRAQRRPKETATGEVVLVMGMPGAGKSSVAREVESQGHVRLNRDTRGGSLADLVSALDAGLAEGHRTWVLDNTYPSRSSRNAVIECAWRYEVPVRCVWLATALADAQINAITRLIEVHGRLPMPEDLREHGRTDPRYFGPDAQFRYERVVEPPQVGEGFTSVAVRPFVREPSTGVDRAGVLLEFDDVLCTTRTGEGVALNAADVVLVSGMRDRLARWAGEGSLLFAQAWRPHVARGEVPLRQVEACFARARELLGLEISITCCPHEAGPPVCWCRKPLPGLLLEFTLPNGVDLRRSVYVGRGAADRTLAQRLGLQYQELQGFLDA